MSKTSITVECMTPCKFPLATYPQRSPSCSTASEGLSPSCSTASEGLSDHMSDGESDFDANPRKHVTWGSVEVISYDVAIECQKDVPPSLPPTPSLPSVPPGLEAPTTLIFRKLPKTLDRASLLAFMNMQGFSAQYDFLYLPLDYKTGLSLGFAFVNFVTNTAARCAIDRCSHLLEINWSQKRRGLQENIEYYGSTALMSPEMPDSFKPILLVNGLRVDFPGVGCENLGRSACKPIKVQDVLS